VGGKWPDEWNEEGEGGEGEEGREDGREEEGDVKEEYERTRNGERGKVGMRKQKVSISGRGRRSGKDRAS
jgi:hypothetical protein